MTGPFDWQPYRPSWRRRPRFALGWRLLALCVVTWIGFGALAVLAIAAIDVVTG